MSEQKPVVIFCTTEDMHPFECGGSPCRHCEKRKTEDHDPETCALCHYFDEEVE